METMKIIKKILVLSVVLLIPVSGQSYSLKQCIDYARKNNSNVKIALLNADIRAQQVSEQVGSGLPQVDINGTLDDNVKITTTLLPGILIGKPGTMVPVQMGTQYNTTMGITLNQKIYDPSFWVGLKAAKLSEGLSKQNMQQTDEQTFYSIVAAYYKASVLQKQLGNLKVILSASGEALKSTELKYKNGMAKKIDVDKLKVSYNNTKSQLDQAELNFKQSLNNLKFAVGLPVENAIEISDSLSENFEENYTVQIDNNSKAFENRIDYKVLQTYLALQEADKENNKAAYWPTLSFYAKYNFQAMRSEFDIFSTNKDWYQNSTIGLSLKIPVFSGFKRMSKVQQSELNIEIAKENLSLSEQSIKVDISNYNIQYKTALDNILNEKENLALAQSVYNNTQLEFSQGAGSSLDLVQAESSLRETQNNYYTRLLTLYIAKLDKEKAEGNLINFINNLK